MFPETPETLSGAKDQLTQLKARCKKADVTKVQQLLDEQLGCAFREGDKLLGMFKGAATNQWAKCTLKEIKPDGTFASSSPRPSTR